MSEWKEYLLEEVIEKFIDYRGKTPKKVKSGIPLITAKVIKDGYILTPDEFIEEVEYDSWMTRGLPKINDVLLTTEAPLGEVALIKDKNIALAQRIILLRGNQDILDNSFLFYSLRDRLMQHRLAARASGSTVKGIKSSELKLVLISLPNLEEQKSIAAVLSCLDRKIENLRKQNETLEAIAQTLFKRWFIDFEFPYDFAQGKPSPDGQPYKSSGGAMQPSALGDIPEGWQVGTLSDEFEITMGQSPSGSSYNEDQKGMIFFQGRTDFGFRFPSIRLYTTEPKRIAETGDILVSVRAPVGDVNVAFEQCCIGRGLSAVHSACSFYCLYKIKSFKSKFNVFESEGTIFGSLNKASFNEIESLIPCKNLVNLFEECVSPSDKQVFNNEKEIQAFTKTRDTLLPKLMNGQLRITP